MIGNLGLTFPEDLAVGTYLCWLQFQGINNSTGNANPISSADYEIRRTPDTSAGHLTEVVDGITVNYKIVFRTKLRARSKMPCNIWIQNQMGNFSPPGTWNQQGYAWNSTQQTLPSPPGRTHRPGFGTSYASPTTAPSSFGLFDTAPLSMSPGSVPTLGSAQSSAIGAITLWFFTELEQGQTVTLRRRFYRENPHKGGVYPAVYDDTYREFGPSNTEDEITGSTNEIFRMLRI